MRQLGKLADRLVSRLVPKADAAACSGCSTVPYHYVGPCNGGYWRTRTCCNLVGPGGCVTHCTYSC
ncbi:hypothetical protein [Dactylosporangium sp. CS-033363]|uniref:hypothetical protein n=1 Tax=Dactylosporangium sp. CS-033363 TaxID=3239935 RepID=UPI003D93D3AB